MRNFILLLLIVFFITDAKSQSGSAVLFDGTSSDSYIDFGYSSSLTNFGIIDDSDKLSITMWVKWDSKAVAGAYSNLFTATNNVGSGDTGVWWVQHNWNNSYFEFALKTTTTRQYINSTTQPAEGVWYHLACVYDGVKCIYMLMVF